VADAENIRSRRTWIYKWLLSAALLGLVLWFVPVRDIANELAAANPWWVIGGLALFVIMRLPSAYRMRLITQRQGMALSTLDLVKISLVTTFFGLLLPGQIAGGAVRWHLLSTRDRKGAEALASIAFDSVNNAMALMSLGLFGLLAASPASLPLIIPWIIGGVFAFLLLVYASLLNPRTTGLVVYLAKRLGLERWPWLHRKIARLIESVQRFHQIPVPIQICLFGLSLVFHLLGVLSFMLLAGALDLDLSFGDCAWLRALLYLVIMLPLTVSGIGVRESALVVLLLPLGVTSVQAVALSALLMAGLLLTAGIGGLLAPGMQYRRGKAASE